MARSTRQQRRARRAQGQPALAGGPPDRPVVRPTANEPAPRPERREEHVQRTYGFGFIRFVQEAIGELRKVEWPNQAAVVSGTAVVLVACVIVGAFLWVNDELWKYVVQHVLLR